MLYFAYGSNLNKEQMKRRCPDSEPVSKVIIRGWRLTYRANPRGEGVATIVRGDVNDVVCGALYRVSEEDIKKLDRFEGRPVVYDRILLAVYKDEEVFAYIMNEGYEPKNPDEEYLGKIRQGYKDWEYPEEKLNTTY